MTIKLTHQELVEMENVPPEMQEVHSTLTSATADFDKSVDYLSTSLTSLDVADVDQASEYMESGIVKLQKTFKLIDTYLAQFK